MELPGTDRCPRYCPEYFTSSGIYALLNLPACAVAPNKTRGITVCWIPSARYENGKARPMPLAGPPPNLELAICMLVREASWCYLGCKHLLDEVLCLTLSHFKVECFFCFVAPKVGALNLTTVSIYMILKFLVPHMLHQHQSSWYKIGALDATATSVFTVL